MHARRHGCDASLCSGWRSVRSAGSARSSLDVVVASNLFGDILTDVGAAIQGGLGFAASANVNPAGGVPSMFEPVHGSAPDITGRGIANPLATIWAGALMLDHVGEPAAAKAIIAAMEAVTAKGEIATADMGGSANTSRSRRRSSLRCENERRPREIAPSRTCTTLCQVIQSMGGNTFGVCR